MSCSEEHGTKVFLFSETNKKSKDFFPCLKKFRMLPNPSSTKGTNRLSYYRDNVVAPIDSTTEFLRRVCKVDFTDIIRLDFTI